MIKSIQFVLVKDCDEEAFISRVNEHLEHGFKPCGGPFTTPFARGFGNVHAFAPDTSSSGDNLTIGIEYNQAMIIETETPSE